MSESEGIFAPLAGYLGTSENALLLLISLFIGYPLGFFYRHYLYGKSPTIQHTYFTLCGIFLCYLNFGLNVVHSLINIVLMYLVLLTTGGTLLSIILAFILNMGYLVIGYAMTMSDEYAVKWTTPHCVLTLRLIGLTFDIYDGRQKEADLNKEQKEIALKKVPSLLEVMGHTYFFGGFLVGPQFPMQRYQSFVKGAFSDPVTGAIPDSVTPALKRLSAGIGYTALYQIGQMYLPDSYLTSEEFYGSGLLTKIFLITLWGKMTLYKYVAAWVITEGACILCGLTYNGKDENGNNLWDACANIYIRRYEFACKTQDLIKAFNVNTNKWMAMYVFKRLKFLGNKEISQGVTLFFLAIWHGLCSGYFMNFFLEFCIVNFERAMETIFMRCEPLQAAVNQSPVTQSISYCIKKFYSQFALSYALVSFCLFSYDKYLAVYWSVWFLGHLLFMGVPLYAPYLKKVLPQTRPSRADKSSTSPPASTATTSSDDTAAAAVEEEEAKKEL